MAKAIQDNSGNYAVVSASGTLISKPCPVCTRSGRTTTSLSLRQVNATEAIYVCNDPDCLYPVGEEITVITRTVPELLPAETADLSKSVQGPVDDQGQSSSVKSGIELNVLTPSLLITDCSLAVEVAPSVDLPGDLDNWLDDLVDPKVCDWLDSQNN